MASRNTLDMTTGPIFRKLLLFAYPLMINTFVNTLYGTADKIIAGRFISDNAMAAIGAAEAPINLLINVFVGISSGVSISCGSLLGAKRTKDLRDCMHTALPAGFLCGLLVCILGLFFTRPLLQATNIPGEILSDASLYMLVRMLGTPILLSSSFCVTILSAHGDTKRITFAGLTSGLANILGNLLFVLVLPFGVAGLAMATVLSQIVSFAIYLFILFSPKDNYCLRLRELRLHWQHLKTIFSIGIPTGINSLVFSFSNVILQTNINSFGPTVVAGNSAADTLQNFAFLLPNQIRAACSCATAQCYGAKNIDRLNRVVKTSLLCCLVSSAGASGIITAFSVPLLRLFTDDPAVAVAGVPNLLFGCWGYIIYCFSLIYVASLQGMHRSATATLLNVLGICVPRLFWIWFIFPFFKTPAMLYIVYPISWTISSVLLGIAYHRTRKNLCAKI